MRSDGEKNIYFYGVFWYLYTMYRTVASGTLIAMALFPVLFSAGCATVSSEDRLRESSAHYQLGVSYLNDNNIQPAYVEFQKALELNPKDKEVLNAIGVIHLLKLEEYAKAMEYFNRAIGIDRSFSEAWNNLGFAYERTGRYADAAGAYKAALANPTYKNAQKAFTNLGRAYYRMKRYPEAINAYKDAIKRFTDFHPPYYGLALSYNASGRYDEAATAMKRAVELDPDFQGDREKARGLLKERRLMVRDEEERDLQDLLEIMNY